MGCNCNSCQDPFVLPVGPPGKNGQNGQQGGTGSAGQRGGIGATGGQGNPGAQGDDGRGYDASTTDSIDVLSTAAVTTTATIDIEKAYTPGARVRFSDVASPATNYFEGIVTSYSPISGVMNVGSIDLKRGTGTISNWNVNLAGELGSGVYDSGWKELNDHNGTFGVAAVTGWTNPSIRVVGRTAYISGTFIVPLGDNGLSTTLRVNASTYGTTYKTDTTPYTGAAGGFILNANGSATTSSSIVPTELRPTKIQTIERLCHAQRAVASTTGSNTIVLDAFWNPVYYNTTGQIQIITHKDIDDTIGTDIKSSPMHLLITKGNTGEYVPTFGVYKHSFTGTGPGTDNRVVTAHPTATYAADYDGEDESKVGGYFFTIDISYPISSSYTEAQVKAAFDSI